MVDLILVAVSMALAALYVVKLYRFPAAQQSKRRDGRTASPRRSSETRP